MARSRLLVTSVLLLCVAPALACNPKDEGSASDSATDTTGAPDTTTPGDPDTTATTPTTGDTGTSGDDSGGLSSGDTDLTATSDQPTTSAGTVATETTATPDTDTGADACPAPDPSLAGVSVSPWESASSGDCSVVNTSNAGGEVSLDLLCGGEAVAVDLTVPADFKVDLEGLLEVKLSIATDAFFEGTSFVLHDLSTGDLVLAAHQMNGFLNYPELAPFSLATTDSCGDSPCDDTSEITFSHVDGPSLALFPGSRGPLSSGGRDYDIVLRSAWQDLCREHVGSYTWIIGASAAK